MGARQGEVFNFSCTAWARPGPTPEVVRVVVCVKVIVTRSTHVVVARGTNFPDGLFDRPLSCTAWARPGPNWAPLVPSGPGVHCCTFDIATTSLPFCRSFVHRYFSSHWLSCVRSGAAPVHASRCTGSAAICSGCLPQSSSHAATQQ